LVIKGFISGEYRGDILAMISRQLFRSPFCVQFSGMVFENTKIIGGITVMLITLKYCKLIEWW